jgi:hypothetical protein
MQLNEQTVLELKFAAALAHIVIIGNDMELMDQDSIQIKNHNA